MEKYIFIYTFQNIVPKVTTLSLTFFIHRFSIMNHHYITLCELYNEEMKFVRKQLRTERCKESNGSEIYIFAHNHIHQQSLN